jgi:hypothetical protein
MGRLLVWTGDFMGKWVDRRMTGRNQTIFGVSNRRVQNGWSWDVEISWAGGRERLQYGTRGIALKTICRVGVITEFRTSGRRNLHFVGK